MSQEIINTKISLIWSKAVIASCRSCVGIASVCWTLVACGVVFESEAAPLVAALVAPRRLRYIEPTPYIHK